MALASEYSDMHGMDSIEGPSSPHRRNLGPSPAPTRKVYCNTTSKDPIIPMASTRSIVAPLSKCSNALGSTSQSFRPSFLPYQSIRCAVTGTSENAAKYRRTEQPGATKKKKTRNAFINYNLRDADQFSLCDAMQYVFQRLNNDLGALTDINFISAT